MRKLVFVFCLLVSIPLYSQWLEQMMYLPDSFSGVSNIKSIICDRINDKLFFVGKGFTVVTIDCATDEKIQPIRIDNALEPDPWCFTYNSNNNCLYGITRFNYGVCTLYAINCQTRQVVATIPIYYRITSYCANSLSNKVYLLGRDSLFIIDAGVHQITRRIGLDTTMYYRPPPIYNPRHNVAYIFSQGKSFILDGLADSIIDTIVFSPIMQPRFSLLDTLNDRFYIWGLDNSSQPPKSKIIIIDCSLNQVISEIGLDTTITLYGVDMDIDPLNQKLYVSPIQGYGQTIWVFDPISSIFEDSICTQFRLYGVKYCTANNRLYVGAYDTILVINPINHQIEYIDLRGFNHNYDFHVVWFLHPLRNKLYIAVNGPYLYIVDCETNQIIKEMVLGLFQPGGLLWNPVTNRFYCTDKMGPFVHCFDASTNQALYTRKLPIPGYGLLGLTVAPPHNKIYIGFPSGVVVLDGATDTVIHVMWFNTSAEHLCYNPTSDKIYTTPRMFYPGYTYIIDCNNDEIINVIRTNAGTFPYCDPRNNKVYITDVSGFGSPTRIIDGLGDTLVATFDSIFGNVAFRDIDDRVYISHGVYLNSIVILNGRTNQVVEYLPNLRSYDLIYNPINDRLYCSSIGFPIWDSTLVLDCISNSIIDTIPIPWVGFHNPTNNKLYAYDHYTNSIVVINGATNEIILRFNEIGNPTGIESPIWNSIQNRTYIYFYEQSRVAVIRDEIPGVEEHQIFDSKRFMPEIYPNPAKSVIRVRGPLSKKTIKIFDVSGKLIKVVNEVTNVHEQEVKFSLKGINPGIYFLRLGKETKKFLVVK